MLPVGVYAVVRRVAYSPKVICILRVILLLLLVRSIDMQYKHPN